MTRTPAPRALLWLLPSLLAFLLLAGSAVSVENATSKTLLSDAGFSPDNCAWQPTAAREEIRPACAVDAAVSRTGANGSLRSTCRTAVEYGGWTRTVPGIASGKWYRFDAYYRAKNVRDESRCVVARLDWQRSDGDRAGQPDYVYHVEGTAGGWKHVWTLAPAPSGAHLVRLELLMGWRPGGTVWWDDISLAETPPPAPRVVRLAALHFRPHGTHSGEDAIARFCAQIDRAAESRPDIICLPEAMTTIGSDRSQEDVAEPIPGPTSARLAEKAKQHHCYLVACYPEREGKAIYNTAVLLDRVGKLVGKYRKAYVPREEIEAGVTPGDECPVFDTDFGKVGMMICWDVQHPEPAQRLALKGAEVILMPIWAGDPTLTKARAIENHVYLVSCEYDNPSRIIDPEGRILAEATDDMGTVAVAAVDLSRRPYCTEWLGDMRARLPKEHREDLR